MNGGFLHKTGFYYEYLLVRIKFTKVCVHSLDFIHFIGHFNGSGRNGQDDFGHGLSPFG